MKLGKLYVFVPLAVTTITNYPFSHLDVNEKSQTHLFLEILFLFGIVCILGIFQNADLQHK